MLQGILEQLVAQEAAQGTRPKSRVEKKAFSSEATQRLKAFWDEHVTWPYPTVRLHFPPVVMSCVSD